MERLTLRDDDGRAIFTPYGLQIYCSTQATADCICKLEEALQAAQEPEETRLVRHYSRPNVYADLWLHCEKCGECVDDNWHPKYCPRCGRLVKWE